MKKILFVLLALASISSAAVGWTGAVHVQQIWISPGPTPFVTITTDQTPSQIFGFYLNPTGHGEMLKLAQEALAQNLYINIYGDPDSAPGHSTGMSAPWISGIWAKRLYSLAISR